MLFRDIKASRVPSAAVAAPWVILLLSAVLFVAAGLLYLISRGQTHDQAIPQAIQSAPALPATAGSPSGAAPSPAGSPFPGVAQSAPPANPSAGLPTRGSTAGGRGYQDVEDDTPAGSSPGSPPLVPNLRLPTAIPSILPTPLIH